MQNEAVSAARGPHSPADAEVRGWQKLSALSSVVDLAFTIFAGALWYLKPELGPVMLTWLASGRVVRTLFVPCAGWRRTTFDLPLLLFLLSAGLGAAIAYDQPAAQGKFWVVVGGLALYDSLALVPERLRLGRLEFRPSATFLAALASVIGAYFLLTNEWGRWPAKLPALDPLRAWFASWQPPLPGHRLNPNVVGGIVASLLPLQVAAVLPGLRAAGSAPVPTLRAWLRRLLALSLIGVSLLALLLTESRGAWFGLLAAILIWWLWRPGSLLSQRTLPARAYRWLPLVVVLLLAAVLSAAVLAAGALHALPMPGSSALAGRVELLTNSITLASDYPFTGLGMSGFQMAYSTYILLLHVGHTFHSHNLFLDIWLEQGLPGLLALGWLLGAAFQTAITRPGAPPHARARAWRLAAVCALTVILLHGLVDDAFYGTRAVLFLFVPFAALARTGGPAPIPTAAAPYTSPQVTSPLAAGVGAALCLAALLMPGVRATFQANLGALAQTQAELSVYSWPQWPIQDALRRSPEVDLQPAIARYRAALALDPGNVPANRRLGQIELSVGQYDSARAHLAAAYQAAAWQLPVRQMVGESYAVNGDVAAAAAVWRTVAAGQNQLGLRQWWYRHIGDKQRATWVAQSVAASGH